MPNSQKPLYVRVEAVTEEAVDVKSYRLRALDGRELPRFGAGAHIGLVLPSRVTRYYSICSAPSDRSHYLIAVQREAGGRGGSLLIHQRVRVGTMLKLHPPRNFFELVDAPSSLLIAGGIGITPIRSMMLELNERKAPHHLIYCIKSRDHLPFADEIQDMVTSGRATLHVSTEVNDPFDFERALHQSEDNRHVYCCGSPPLMLAVKAATRHWPQDRVHFEVFTPVKSRTDDVSFYVTTQRSQKRLRVGADQSILEALRDNGIDPDSVCENGTCGTCKLSYLDGEIDHRDQVLTGEQRKREIMVCVSRALVSQRWPLSPARYQGRPARLRASHIPSESRQANRRLRAGRSMLMTRNSGCGLGRVGSVDYQTQPDQVGMAGL
jgi:phthalate 4,5-dioxygenase reductase component